MQVYIPHNWWGRATAFKGRSNVRVHAHLCRWPWTCIRPLPTRRNTKFERTECAQREKKKPKKVHHLFFSSKSRNVGHRFFSSMSFTCARAPLPLAASFAARRRRRISSMIIFESEPDSVLNTFSAISKRAETHTYTTRGHSRHRIMLGAPSAFQDSSVCPAAYSQHVSKKVRKV